MPMSVQQLQGLTSVTNTAILQLHMEILNVESMVLLSRPGEVRGPIFIFAIRLKMTRNQ